MGKDENVISSSNADTKSADDSVLPPVAQSFSLPLMRSRSLESVRHPPKSAPKSGYDEELDRELEEEKVKQPKQIRDQGQNEEEEWHPTEEEKRKFFAELLRPPSPVVHVQPDTDTDDDFVAGLWNLEKTSQFFTRADVLAQKGKMSSSGKTGALPTVPEEGENEQERQEKKRTEIKA